MRRAAHAGGSGVYVSYVQSSFFFGGPSGRPKHVDLLFKWVMKDFQQKSFVLEGCDWARTFGLGWS